MNELMKNELFDENELKILKEQEVVKQIPILNEGGIVDSKSLILRIKEKITTNRNSKDWIEDYILLLNTTNLSPVQAADILGINYLTVQNTAKKLKQEGDSSLYDLLQESKKAYAEFIMFHPEHYKGNAAMAIFMAKSQAGWSENSINEFGVPSDQELEQIFKARQELINEYNKLEHAHKVGLKEEPPLQLSKLA